ncbi:hypothetical protein RCZAHN_82 [Rhodobacter phage RcZahn]|nr:hypothetical protein RCZAHN_82 [Rhodobacter phage RcZahn]
MKRLFFSFVGLLATAFAFLTPILQPVAALGDRFMTLTLNFLDDLVPFAAVAGPVGMHPLAATREVQYLQNGLHRLAQPVSMRVGDPEDPDDDDGSDIDNGFVAGGSRMIC